MYKNKQKNKQTKNKQNNYYKKLFKKAMVRIATATVHKNIPVKYKTNK